MTIELSEYPPSFDEPLARDSWQVHTPVDVLVDPIVDCDHDASDDRDVPRVKYAKWYGGQAGYEHEHRPIPPSHGYSPLVFVVDEVISLIVSEDFVVSQGVCFEWITESSEWSMHHKAM